MDAFEDDTQFPAPLLGPWDPYRAGTVTKTLPAQEPPSLGSDHALSLPGPPFQALGMLRKVLQWLRLPLGRMALGYGRDVVRLITRLKHNRISQCYGASCRDYLPLGLPPFFARFLAAAALSPRRLPARAAGPGSDLCCAAKTARGFPICRRAVVPGRRDRRPDPGQPHGNDPQGKI